MAFFGKSEKEGDGDYDKEITKNKIILFLVPKEDYQVELLRISRNVADNFGKKIAYVSLNKPTETIIDNLKKNNIDTKKFLFIDAVAKKSKSDQDAVCISSLKNFEKFKGELNKILEKEKIKCLIFDSLSTMLIYQDENIIVKFTHDLITNLIEDGACGEFMCLSEDVDSTLIKDVSMFVDKVLNLEQKKEETELAGKDWKKREKIIKTEGTLESIRKAYALKLMSEASYLKSKKRIEEKLARLRK